MITIDICLFETGEVIKTLEGEEEEKVLAEAMNTYVIIVLFLLILNMIIVDLQYG